MGATLFKEVGYSLSKLIEDIDHGEIGLPDIQRPFVWKKSKVRDLFDSMYNGFPVGYLLFWSSVSANGARQIGTGTKQAPPRLLIVDGQQRLTSLYAVLKGRSVLRDDYAETTLDIAFRPRDRQFTVADAAVRRDPEYIPNISELWSAEQSRNRFVKNFISNLKKAHELSEDEEDDLTEAIDRLYDLQSYPFTALELSRTLDAEKVAEIFVRINSKGVTLKQADFILTLMSVWWDAGRKDLESFCRDARSPSTGEPSPFNYFIQPEPDQLLRAAIGFGFRRGQLRHVYSLLRGRDIETGQYSDERRVEQFEQLQRAQAEALDLNNWHGFLKALIRAGYRSDRMITSDNALLYSYVFYLIGKEIGVDRDALRELIARWFFMAALTGRYSGSPESTVESDLLRLRGVKGPDGFISALDDVIDSTLTTDFWDIQLPNALATSAARSPSLYGYYAALNLLDARLLFSRLGVRELFDPSLHENRASIERHHLFPRGYLKSIGIEASSDVNQIANFALLEWPDNAAIADAAPRDYFPELSARHEAAELAQMRFWHALPEGWEEMEYSEFLRARRKLLAKVVRQAFQELRHPEARSPDKPTVDDVVRAGESAAVEFKSSARWNEHISDRDERIELAVLKTIAAFANSDGGTLLIGVNDEGDPVGLESDLKLVPKHDLDRFELWITQFLEQCIGTVPTAALAVDFPELNGTTVCRVSVPAAHSPVFVNPPGEQDDALFFVRTGNSTRQLTAEELLAYQATHWPSG